MGGLLKALSAERIKSTGSPMVWVTLVAFSLAPLMGGVFMLIMRNPEALAKASGLETKAQVMHFEAHWDAYLGMLSQAVGVGGVLVFGFVASWLFGREYSDGTAKDLLALPTSRTTIINAKFVLYLFWCFALSITNLLVGFLIGTLLQLPSVGLALVANHLTRYFMTTLLTVLLGSPLAFFALWGKGYLTPLGFVALTLVLAQIIAASGYGGYFPWSIPGLFSGAGGAYQSQLTFTSYLHLFLIALAGYLSTVAYWERADHSD